MSFLKQLDWKLNLGALFLVAVSLASLSSFNRSLFHKQIFWVLIGLFLFFLMIKFDWRPFINYRGVLFGLYGLMILLLILTYFKAAPIRGVRGWLSIGSFQFQVSELAKLILVIFFAQFFSRRHIGIGRVSNLIISFIYFLVPSLLIAIQPD